MSRVNPTVLNGMLARASAELERVYALLDAAGAGDPGAGMPERVASLIAERDIARGITNVALGTPVAEATLRALAAHLGARDVPVGDLLDAVNALAATVHESPAGTRHVVDRLPGLAHAVDRVTRFADPPVDVFAHREAGAPPTAPVPGTDGEPAVNPCRVVVCLECRDTVMTLPNGTLPEHQRPPVAGEEFGTCGASGTTEYRLPTITPPRTE